MRAFSGSVASRAALSAVLLAAASMPAAQPASAGPGLLSFGVGQFDHDYIDTGSVSGFFDAGDRAGTAKAAEFRLEYRFGTPLWSYSDWFELRPMAGLSATSDGMLYGMGGLAFDFTLGPVVFTPSFGAGLWSRGGGKDLGHPLEFRTMFEIGYRFENQARLTVGFSHMSNADISDENPGANSLLLYVHVPVNALLGD
ncbi:MAG TPA: acyloxyacyl hydrolase [Azospirillaceae bacterium]|nr:acyloxyacyl hydrolase [Azospirillaceae bacterium]